MFRVEIIKYDELSDQQKENVPDNGFGKENANYLKMTYGDRESIISDAVEPEDATFSRDFSGVAIMIERAYLYGKGEGDA